MDREKKLQKAKEIIHFEGYKTYCYSALYITLRNVFKLDFKESLKIVLKEAKENRISSISYKEIYNCLIDREECGEEIEVSALQEMERIKAVLDFLKKVEEKNKPPKSVLMNLIWLEATRNINGNINSFLSDINKLKNKLYNLSKG